MFFLKIQSTSNLIFYFSDSNGREFYKNTDECVIINQLNKYGRGSSSFQVKKYKKCIFLKKETSELFFSFTFF